MSVVQSLLNSLILGICSYVQQEPFLMLERSIGFSREGPLTIGLCLGQQELERG